VEIWDSSELKDSSRNVERMVRKSCAGKVGKQSATIRERMGGLAAQYIKISFPM
jgi:hypothetical protein